MAFGSAKVPEWCHSPPSNAQWRVCVCVHRRAFVSMIATLGGLCRGDREMWVGRNMCSQEGRKRRRGDVCPGRIDVRISRAAVRGPIRGGGMGRARRQDHSSDILLSNHLPVACVARACVGSPMSSGLRFDAQCASLRQRRCEERQSPRGPFVVTASLRVARQMCCTRAGSQRRVRFVVIASLEPQSGAAEVSVAW